MIIYTANIGRYDVLRPLPEGVTGICFTDGVPDPVRGWEFRAPAFNIGTSRACSWWHKWASHLLFPGEETLWIDANYELRRLPPSHDLALFPHFNRKCNSVWAEIGFTTLCKRWPHPLSEREAVDAFTRYRAEGFPDAGGHAETGFLVRRPVELTQRVNEIMLAENGFTGGRDQTVFDYAVWKAGATWTRLEGVSIRNPYATLHGHAPRSVARPARQPLYFFTPYDSRGLGYAYNACAEIVPDNDAWICLLDADVMLFPPNFGEVIARAVGANPQYDVYTCRATRAGAGGERCMIGADVEQERDLVKLREAALLWQNSHVNMVSPWEGDLVGHFLLFRKRLWQEIRFPNEGYPTASRWAPNRAPPRVLGVDTAWSRLLAKAGKKIGMLDGVVAVHYFRMGVDETSHLRFLEGSVER